jgi:exodeoxyribonuclease VII small subunit
MSPAAKDRNPKVDQEPGYADAIVELEGILEELEGDDLDVDVLAERVRRAGELVKVCRTRISRASADVERIVADLDSYPDLSTDDPAGVDDGAGADE